MSNKKKIRHSDYNAPVTNSDFGFDEDLAEEHTEDHAEDYQEPFEETEEPFEEPTQEHFSATELIGIYKMLRADPTEQI